MFLWSREGFCHSMKISCGSTGEVLWYPAGEGILGGGSVDPQVGSRVFHGGLRDPQRFWSWW